MTTAVIGAGGIGRAVATHLAGGGEPVVLASRDLADATRVADEIGAGVTAERVEQAVADSDVVVLALWIDVSRAVVAALGDRLAGKVVVDPSNPIAASGSGGFVRTLPDDVTAVSGLVPLLPASAAVVKAFGTISATDLAAQAHRVPDQVVLFHAGDAAAANERVSGLIATAGFDPVALGGLDRAIRIEMFGDLHQGGGLQGRLLTRAEALALV